MKKINWKDRVLAAGLKEHRVLVHPEDWPKINDVIRRRQQLRLVGGDTGPGLEKQVQATQRKLAILVDALVADRGAQATTEPPNVPIAANPTPNVAMPPVAHVLPDDIKVDHYD